MQIQDHSFVKYVVCSQCAKLYSYENALEKKGNNVETC